MDLKKKTFFERIEPALQKWGILCKKVLTAVANHRKFVFSGFRPMFWYSKSRRENVLIFDQKIFSVGFERNKFSESSHGCGNPLNFWKGFLPRKGKHHHKRVPSENFPTNLTGIAKSWPVRLLLLVSETSKNRWSHLEANSKAPFEKFNTQQGGVSFVCQVWLFYAHTVHSSKIVRWPFEGNLDAISSEPGTHIPRMQITLPSVRFRISEKRVFSFLEHVSFSPSIRNPDCTVPNQLSNLSDTSYRFFIYRTPLV